MRVFTSSFFGKLSMNCERNSGKFKKYLFSDGGGYTVMRIEAV